MYFDQNRSIVTITSNGTDECLEWKFIPAEISYKSFRRMLEYNKETDEDNQDDEYRSEISILDKKQSVSLGKKFIFLTMNPLPQK